MIGRMILLILDRKAAVSIEENISKPGGASSEASGLLIFQRLAVG